MLRSFKNALLVFTILYFFAPISYSNEVLINYKNEAINIVKEHCGKGQFFDPPKQFLYFSKLKDNEIGICLITPAYYTIKIDSVFWKHATESERYEVMIHEVTHCTLLLDHTSDKTNYMYYNLVGLPKEVIKSQFEDNLRRHCGH